MNDLIFAKASCCTEAACLFCLKGVFFVVSVVIVAGGKGRRMGAGVNKVYLPLNGKEIIARTVKAFENCGVVDEIVVVTGDEDIERCRSIVQREGFTKVKAVAEGGSERQHSVYNGILLCRGDIVAVHDAARCLITEEEISAVIDDAKKYGAAALGVTVKDTLKTVDENGNIIATVDRGKTVHIQTPQVFNRTELKALHERAAADNISVTDDCSIFESYGKTVHVTIGSYDNIKITTPGDISIGEKILEGREK